MMADEAWSTDAVHSSSSTICRRCSSIRAMHSNCCWPRDSPTQAPPLCPSAPSSSPPPCLAPTLRSSTAFSRALSSATRRAAAPKPTPPSETADAASTATVAAAVSGCLPPLRPLPWIAHLLRLLLLPRRLADRSLRPSERASGRESGEPQALLSNQPSPRTSARRMRRLPLPNPDPASAAAAEATPFCCCRRCCSETDIRSLKLTSAEEAAEAEEGGAAPGGRETQPLPPSLPAGCNAPPPAPHRCSEGAATAGVAASIVAPRNPTLGCAVRPCSPARAPPPPPAAGPGGSPPLRAAATRWSHSRTLRSASASSPGERLGREALPGEMEGC